LSQRGIRCFLVDADGIAMEKKMVQSANMAVLGFLSVLSLGPYNPENIENMITRKVPAKFLEKNREVFREGMKAVQG
jgi:Pyruvate/2-oxoacid:ferredoxin oxidoreductase gamma subunit